MTGPYAQADGDDETPVAEVVSAQRCISVQSLLGPCPQLLDVLRARLGGLDDRIDTLTRARRTRSEEWRACSEHTLTPPSGSDRVAANSMCAWPGKVLREFSFRAREKALMESPPAPRPIHRSSLCTDIGSQSDRDQCCHREPKRAAGPGAASGRRRHASAGPEATRNHRGSQP
ncbi:hypothetical protein GCM10010172_67220 [Paractinoplanes ferrugineus]|uniref:Uncharacterized protein n=1 Tax=Paractinoplanes ferrugineus TaxID=113564 RepID=A0A919J4B4_9ACTN|nr:hypothetical protein Afe05nite_49570 [Actinoplanes ferrugineus]